MVVVVVGYINFIRSGVMGDRKKIDGERGIGGGKVKRIEKGGEQET